MYERLIMRGWKSGLTSERKNFLDWSLGAAIAVTTAKNGGRGEDVSF